MKKKTCYMYIRLNKYLMESVMSLVEYISVLLKNIIILFIPFQFQSHSNKLKDKLPTLEKKWVRILTFKYKSHL